MKDVSKSSPYGAIRFVAAHFYGSKVPVTYLKVRVVTDEVNQSTETTDHENEQDEQDAMTTDEVEQNTKFTNKVEHTDVAERPASCLPYEIYDNRFVSIIL